MARDKVKGKGNAVEHPLPKEFRTFSKKITAAGAKISGAKVNKDGTVKYNVLVPGQPIKPLRFDPKHPPKDVRHIIGS